VECRVWSVKCRVKVSRFSNDALHFSWQAQRFGDLHRHFVWQVQHFRRVMLHVFANRFVRAASVKWRQGANCVDVLTIDGNLARKLRF